MNKPLKRIVKVKQVLDQLRRSPELGEHRQQN